MSDAERETSVTSPGMQAIDRAMEAAEDAMDVAEDALEEAQGAMTSANGKNKVFHRSSAPSSSEGLTSGDTWFDTADDYKMYTWNGSSWIAETFGEGAIANAAITNAKIANATIQYGKIASLDMGTATTGKLKAQYIDVTNLFAQDITATNSFQLDTENCKLKAVSGSYGRSGFELSVSDSSSYGGLTCKRGDFRLSSTSSGYSSSVVGDGGSLDINATSELRLDSNFVAIGTEDSNSKVNIGYYYGTVNIAGTINAPSLDNQYSKILTVESKSASISVSKNSTANSSFSVSKSGYTPLGIVGWQFPSSSSSYMFLPRLYLSGTNCYWLARNTSGSDYSGTLTVDVLYVKN
jgi:hypothetical protein